MVTKNIIVIYKKLGLYAFTRKNGSVGLTNKKFATHYTSKTAARAAIKKLAITGLKFVDLNKGRKNNNGLA